jgi:hypothetical protein
MNNYSGSGESKPKKTIYIQRLADGEVVGEVLDDQGRLEYTKNFGYFTEDEYEGLLDAIGREAPEIAVAVKTVAPTDN